MICRGCLRLALRALEGWSVVAGVLLFASVASAAGDFTVFGPKVYTRAAGKPVTARDVFIVQNPSLPYSLRIRGDHLTSAEVKINGSKIKDLSDDENSEERSGAIVDAPIRLQATNTVEVTVKGKPGSSLTLEIVGADVAPPNVTATASPAANAGGWNNASVVVSFQCSDAESGVSSCPLPVTVATEGANQIVSGLAVTLFGSGLTAFIGKPFVGATAPAVRTRSRPSGARSRRWSSGTRPRSTSSSPRSSPAATC